MMVPGPIAAAMLAAVAAPSPQAGIEAALTASAGGWNAGDLNRFMAVYADDAVYVAGGTVARGKAQIAARYAKSFADGGNTRGRLSFQAVAVRPLSAVHVLYVARWRLAGAKTEEGYTTLLFERRREGWRIISDHSS